MSRRTIKITRWTRRSKKKEETGGDGLKNVAIPMTLRFHWNQEKMMKFIKMANLSLFELLFLSLVVIDYANGENYSVLSCNTQSTVSIPSFIFSEKGDSRVVRFFYGISLLLTEVEENYKM